MYDEELRIHVDELNNAKKVYDEKDHERNQLRAEYEVRMNEKRKFEELQEVIRQKE